MNRFTATVLSLVAVLCFGGTFVQCMSKVCYYTDWSVYRQGPSGNFQPNDIDFSVCNYIMYSFVELDGETYNVKLADPWADLPDGGGHGFIEKVIALAASNDAEVIVSLGGWTDSGHAAYGTLMTTDSLQVQFVQHVVAFITKYGFKGLDIDYEYPQCPQGNCRPGDAEKKGFSKLLGKLRSEFNKHGFKLTAAVNSAADNIDKYYEAEALNQNLDWIGMMTYDYAISSQPKVGLEAPFFQFGSEPATWNVQASVEAWLSRGVAANKLVLGVPLYGASFTLADASKNTIGSSASGPGSGGGPMFYNQICDLQNQGWTVVTEENGKPIGGTYAYKDNQWVGYDDVSDVQAKGQYIKSKGLQGYMVWEVSGDDFKGLCGQGKYPLLSALSQSVGESKLLPSVSKKVNSLTYFYFLFFK
uniref:Probable chitinase 3 n=1 Tax=Cacopsylla melanoneura TaxID=428564 RepID=A0A8D8WSD5_9HEMI